MKTLVLGFIRRSGKAKKSGLPFDFAQLIIGTPIEEVSNDNFTVRGEGYQVNELSLELGAEAQFRGVRFPAVLDLKMDVRPGRGGQMEAVCVGFNPGPVSSRQAG